MSDPELTEVLSEAVVLYIGHGTAAFPQFDIEALDRRFGARMAADLQRIIDGLGSEAWTLDNELHTPPSIKRLDAVAEVFRDLHPELSEPAVRALMWALNYELR